MIIGFAPAPSTGFNCGDTLVDSRDGQKYATVQIGTQCWMAENLNVGTMVISVNTGSNHSDVSNNGVIEKYCYNNDSSYCTTYGGLYDWDETMGYTTTEGAQGICPSGWHIPTDGEWTTLETYLGGSSVAGGKMKEAGYTHWNSPNTGATNSSGFTGLPGGYRNYSGYFYITGDHGTFWSSSVFSSTTAWYRRLHYNYQNVSRNLNYRTYGFSVRCVRDSVPCTVLPDQANAGPDSLNIPGDSLQLQANTPVVGSGKWTVKSGNGGVFSDSTSATSWFYGIPDSTYTLVWTISTQCGSSSDTVIIGFACSPLPDRAIAGRDSLNIPGDSMYLYANTPTAGNGQWTIVNGQGGVIADSSSATSLFTGMPDSVYALVWTISTQCGTNADTVIIGFAPAPVSGFNCGDSLIDIRDGKSYGTVQIGNQCWMSQNLDHGQFIPITQQSGNNMIVEKYCYGDSIENCAVYGGLYQWDELMAYDTLEKGQGICPNGWHVPSVGEYDTLVRTLGGNVIAGAHLKQKGNALWASPNWGATDLSGFGALPGGSGWSFVGYNGKGYYTGYSSSTKIKNGFSYPTIVLTNNSPMAEFWPSDPFMVHSVRCISDSLFQCIPNVSQAEAGPDSLTIADSSLILPANNPETGHGIWILMSGQGGGFADSTQYNTVFTGQLGETYVLVWNVYNTCGITIDSLVLEFVQPINSYTCGDTLVDSRDGQKYATVQIGTQCWMAENLNVGIMVNSVYTSSSHSDVSNNGVIEKYCYNNDPSYCTTYGGLYDWDEAMGYTTTDGAQGICPSGWHIPTDAEWCTLTTYLDANVNCNNIGWSGTVAGGKLKEAGFDHWDSPNAGATNSSGFTALGAGYRTNRGIFDYLRIGAYFWSSSVYSSTEGLRWLLFTGYVSVNRHNAYNTYGYSVRCLRDSNP